MVFVADVFDCKKCAEAARESKGCYGAKDASLFVFGGIDFFQCPVRLVKGWTKLVLEMWSHYRMGFLPYAGGIMDQPPKLLKAFAVVSGTIAEFEQEQARKKK